MSLIYLLIAVAAILYIWFGMLVASSFANLYAFQHIQEPPAWKVYLIVIIWPLSFLGLIYDSIRQSLKDYNS